MVGWCSMGTFNDPCGLCPGFQQSAGFLRIFGGSEPLDALPIHPESGLAAWLGDGPTNAQFPTNVLGQLSAPLSRSMIGEVREDDDWIIYYFFIYLIYYHIYIYIKMNLSLSMLYSLSMSILSLSILVAARVRESVDSCVTFFLGRPAAFKVNREA